jgi:hypothetical protein
VNVGKNEEDEVINDKTRFSNPKSYKTKIGLVDRKNSPSLICFLY